MSIFAPDFSTDPYWWLDAPQDEGPAVGLPAQTDVAIVGSGYTGLAAALTLARGARAVLVLEAGRPGQGASTRNAGNVSRTLKWSFASLAEKHGVERAAAFYREAALAIEHLDEVIRTEQIACHFKRTGRYYAAHSPRAYEALAREVDSLRRHVGYEADMVTRAEQHRHVGTDRYHGGQVVHGPGYLHGALYHAGLLERARAAGAVVASETRVIGIEREQASFTIRTTRGIVKAREAIVATNAYTGRNGPVFDYLRRRLIPVNTFALATEPVDPALIARIVPGGRPVIDTHKVVFHIQPTPDGTRLIYGGRAGRQEPDLATAAKHLRDHFVALLPALAPVRISRCWDGKFAFTFDMLPHIGVRDGIHFAVGCCGTGIPLGTYLGHKLALRILGRADATTAFDERSFPTAPLYDGEPWFLPSVVRYYAFRDALPF